MAKNLPFTAEAKLPGGLLGPFGGSLEVAVLPLLDTGTHARPRASVEAHTRARAGMFTADVRGSVFTAGIKNERET